MSQSDKDEVILRRKGARAKPMCYLGSSHARNKYIHQYLRKILCINFMCVVKIPSTFLLRTKKSVPST